MQGTMLEISKSDFSMCTVLLGQLDDYILQGAAYHLQQAAEKALKYVYSQVGMQTPETHDISMRLVGLGDTTSRFPAELLSNLETRADTLTKWEEKTRYPNDYMATRKMVVANVDMVKELLDFVESEFSPRAKTRSSKSRKLNFGEKP